MTIDSLAAMFETAPVMAVVGSFFLINMSLTLFEICLDLFTRKERRWKDTGANTVILFANELLGRTAFGAIGFLALLPFYWLTPIDIPMTWWSWLLAVVLADFTYYWMHRLEHEHRILWAIHSVHHSSEDFNLTVAVRLCVVEGLVEWIFLVPMVLLGFNPFQVLIAIVLVAQYQHWIHTERVTKLGWLDKIFNTPSVHRVHHGSNRQYLDKNYGGILMIWDHLFGTFEPEEEKVVYGLTRNINTNNPVTINTVEFSNIWKDLRRCRTWKDRMRILFGGLNWRPDYFGGRRDQMTVPKQKE